MTNSEARKRMSDSAPVDSGAIGRLNAAEAVDETGLHQKYRVERLGDTTGKHAECWYFVLDPKHDPRARLALRLYAHFARTTGGEDGQRLWDDIQGQLRDLCLRENLCFNCLDAVKGHRGECSFVFERIVREHTDRALAEVEQRILDADLVLLGHGKAFDSGEALRIVRAARQGQGR